MKVRHFLGCLLAVAGLLGCSVHTDDYRGGSTVAAGTVAPVNVVELGEEIVGTSDEHLARLESLSLFEVGDLLERLPEMATNCYGSCPEWLAMTEAEQQAEIDALREHQEARLAALTAIAIDVHEERDALVPADVADADAHLGALRRLDIVGVGELVLTEAESSPYCYNLPCGEDVARADEENATRVAEIAEIASRAEGL